MSDILSLREHNLHKVRVYEWTGSALARFDVRIPADPGPAASTPGTPAAPARSR